MRCIERIKRLAASVGATVDEAMLVDCQTIIVDAPAGYSWDANGGASLVCNAEVNRYQTDWIGACKDTEERMRHGLSKSTPEESASIEHERDEPWPAPADAPERLAVTA